MNNKFKRLFSLSMHKNMKISLGKMCFSSDFTNTERGNLYPCLERGDDCDEKIENGVYSVNGTVCRAFVRYFPYASYQITLELSDGEIGFAFDFSSFGVKIAVGDGKISCKADEIYEEFSLPTTCGDVVTLCVTARPGAFDLYLEKGGVYSLVGSFANEKFLSLDDTREFDNTHACVFANGKGRISSVESFIDNGISIADIRTIRYENADVMVENGKIYLTATVRTEENCYQGVFSWIPGTSELELCGALFFDVGDGRVCGDVASSILYNRKEKLWYLWVCSFSHGHIPAHSVFDGDPRFGVNIVDVTLTERADETAKYSDFVGLEGDEDPDFFYDEENDRWLMAICRLIPETKNYSYVFFESKSPFDGYKYLGRGYDGAETGGSFVKLCGKTHFICGNGYGIKSNYRVYSESGMQNLEFDLPDGGFRGWGTLICVKKATRTHRYLLTFDRMLGSNWNWSYGNLYCFEEVRSNSKKNSCKSHKGMV